MSSNVAGVRNRYFSIEHLSLEGHMFCSAAEHLSLQGLYLESGKEIFPGYRLCQPVGKSRRSIVWEAERDAGERVALKFLPSSGSLADCQEIKSIRMVADLGHSHLTHVHRICTYKKCFVIAMELSHGNLLDLSDAYQAEYGMATDARDLCSLLSQAAQGIDYLNARQHQVDGRVVGIQHCNIKPSNLLVFGDTLKVADYSRATISSAPGTSRRPVSAPAQMAPEVFYGRVSGASDQFSLAVTYCQLRGGQLPFSAADADAPPDRRWSRLDLSMLPVKEQPIIARALSYLPLARWPSCSQMMDRLSEAVAEPDPKVVKPKGTQHQVRGKLTSYRQNHNQSEQRGQSHG